MIQFFSIENTSDGSGEREIHASDGIKDNSIEPLTIYNLLPCDLFLEIKVANETQKARLGSGESLPVYFDATICVRIHGCRWSETFSFQPSTEIQVRLEDLTYIDGSINVNAKMSLDSIDITTPFWFVNHTNLDIQFSDGGSRCSLGPSPYIDGRSKELRASHIR